jgi:hypothetical protein
MIKKFENFNSEEELSKELEDIFSSIDIDFPCSVEVTRRGLEFEVLLAPYGDIKIKDFLDSVWEKILFSKKMGFDTNDRNRRGKETKNDERIKYYGDMQIKPRKDVPGHGGFHVKLISDHWFIGGYMNLYKTETDLNRDRISQFYTNPQKKFVSQDSYIGSIFYYKEGQEFESFDRQWRVTSLSLFFTHSDLT